MTALVVFDIEAVPDFEAARRLLAQPDDARDVEIRRMLGERYSRDGADPATAFLKVPIYRIVSIAALHAKREDGGSLTSAKVSTPRGDRLPHLSPPPAQPSRARFAPPSTCWLCFEAGLDADRREGHGLRG